MAFTASSKEPRIGGTTVLLCFRFILDGFAQLTRIQIWQMPFQKFKQTHCFKRTKDDVHLVLHKDFVLRYLFNAAEPEPNINACTDQHRLVGVDNSMMGRAAASKLLGWLIAHCTTPVADVLSQLSGTKTIP